MTLNEFITMAATEELSCINRYKHYEGTEEGITGNPNYGMDATDED